MTDLLLFVAWSVAILALGFIASALVAAVIDRARMARRPAPEPDPERDNVLAVGEYLLDHMPDPGQEVWVRVSRCTEHGGRHVEMQLLPTLKGEL